MSGARKAAASGLLAQALLDAPTINAQGVEGASPPEALPSPAIVYALGLVALAHCRLYGSRRSGRPPHSFERNLLIHSAFAAEIATSRSKTAAADAVCRRLGPPVTKSIVGKAIAAVEAELAHRYGAPDAPAALALITRATKHLDRVERRMKAEGQTSAQLRSADRHVRASSA